MSLVKTITSGIGKLFVVAALLGAFIVGLVSVVYLSLQGETIQVPEIIGKNKSEAEKELVALGLKIKKRADRYSEEKPDTILEQLPKSGETVKTGQVITVVVARQNPEGTEAPAVAKTPEENKDDENEDSISPELRRKDKEKDKKKISNANVNANKKGNQNNNSNSNKSSNKNTSLSNTKTGNKSSVNSTGTTNKSGNTTVSTPKPTPASNTKPATSGDTRDRKVPGN
jgi:eukaryotic-like serine/threonine-protein kinase